MASSSSASAPKRSLLRTGFDWWVILVGGLVLGGFGAGIHYLRYLAGSLYGLFAPLWDLVYNYGGLIVILFVLMRWYRRRTGSAKFIDIMTHTLVICFLAGMVRTGYEGYFYRQVDPNVDVTRVALRYHNFQKVLHVYDYIGADGPNSASKQNLQELRDTQELLLTQYRELKARPYNQREAFRQNLLVFLLMGLFWGFILGIIFRSPRMKA